MPWRPAHPTHQPDHPFGDLEMRVAELVDRDREVVGYLLVEVDTWWRLKGRWWWKRYSETPTFSLEYWESARGEVSNVFLFGEDDYGPRLRDLRDGVWPLSGTGDLLRIRWLPVEEGDAITRDVFGLDPDLARTRKAT